jgi:signal transduction histidine kinase
MIRQKLKIIFDHKDEPITRASLIVSFLVLLTFVVESFFSYKTEVKNAHITTQNLSQVLVEQVKSTFEQIDDILDEFDLDFGHSIASNNYDVKKINAWLGMRKARIPQALGFRLVNPKGDFIADDSGIIPKQNVSDREYFQTILKNPKLKNILIRPVVSKINHVWITGMAKPILDQSGKLKAIVVATVSLDYFMGKFKPINIGERGVIGILDYDRIMYLRVPSLESALGKVFPANFPIQEFIHSNLKISNFSSLSPYDGVLRSFSMRKIDEFKLVITVGVADNDILYFWYTRTAIYIFGILGLFIFYFSFLFNYLESQDKLDEQRKTALQSAKLSSLGQMAGGIAHEINNPLTIIMATATRMRRLKTSEDNEKLLNESIDKINSTVERIAKIIRGLRNFSRDSYNDPTLPTSLNKIIDETLVLCAEAFRHNDVQITVLPFEDVNVDVREVQIEQVFLNLFNNAYDAIAETPMKWIKIKVLVDQSHVKIMVIDSGPRIKDSVAEMMLEPFFTTKEIGKGTGLGLSISKGIVEAHNGQLYYNKNYPNTCFVVELPRSRS